MLPFTAEVLRASIAQYNAGLWPLHLPALALGFAVLVLCLRPVGASGRTVAAILAAASVGAGALFYLDHFATLAFFAPVLGWLWVAQGVLLLSSGVVRGGLRPAPPRTWSGWMGAGLLALGLLWPAVEVLATPAGWEAARVFGLTAAPAAVMTLGVLLLAEGRPPLLPAVLPLLWAVAQGAIGWILGMPLDIALAGLIAAATGVAAWRRLATR